MTDYEVYDKFFADEEYELENAPSELYSYRSGWNTALKRASIVIRNEIRPEGEWEEGNHGDYERPDFYFQCSVCKEETDDTTPYCPFCGSKMKGSGE